LHGTLFANLREQRSMRMLLVRAIAAYNEAEEHDAKRIPKYRIAADIVATSPHLVAYKFVVVNSLVDYRNL
jgi:hypothetical protein